MIGTGAALRSAVQKFLLLAVYGLPLASNASEVDIKSQQMLERLESISMPIGRGLSCRIALGVSGASWKGKRRLAWCECQTTMENLCVALQLTPRWTRLFHLRKSNDLIVFLSWRLFAGLWSCTLQHLFLTLGGSLPLWGWVLHFFGVNP